VAYATLEAISTLHLHSRYSSRPKYGEKRATRARDNKQSRGWYASSAKRCR